MLGGPEEDRGLSGNLSNCPLLASLSKIINSSSLPSSSSHTNLGRFRRIRLWSLMRFLLNTQLGTQWLHHRISIFNVYFLKVVRQHRRVRLTTLIVRLNRVRIIRAYVPVYIRHFFAARRKHFCNPRSAPPFAHFVALHHLAVLAFNSSSESFRKMQSWRDFSPHKIWKVKDKSASCPTLE
jgi:hypothetical protein